jgi:transposase, IS5 family
MNRIKSAIRACVEHVTGGMTMCMREKLTRKIGFERIKASWGMKNLTYNFLRLGDFQGRCDSLTATQAA